MIDVHHHVFRLCVKLSLTSTGYSLIDCYFHYNILPVRIFQLDLEEQYLGLKTLVTVRLDKLNEAKKLHDYLKDVDELADWVNEQMQIASSAEYGHDFEQLQVSYRMK